jgi:hypothetical protein
MYFLRPQTASEQPRSSRTITLCEEEIPARIMKETKDDKDADGKKVPKHPFAFNR